MPRRAPTSSGYRPALDGLRGVAVLAVLVFHLWPAGVQGGWLGVDLFFVLSGDLITSLLVREYARSGRIDLRRFWTARARRLLPSLITVLIAVLAAAAFWTPSGRRSSVALDTLATLFYVQNWRLLASNEAYFDANGVPSPLRHAWSLAIEEQYYLLFPLLFLVLARYVHRRWTLALVFAVAAAASAAWMAYLFVPDVDPTRVYYGTDTRAFELLIGAAIGAWVGPSQWGHERPSRWVETISKLAWPSLAALLVAFVALSEDSPLVFRGGLVVVCLLTLPAILAAASPHANAFQRALSFEPLRQIGLISYALYLWHWPVHVFLTPERLGMGTAAAALVQAVLSIVFATLTYRYLEAPIRAGGLRGLVPRSPRISRLVAVTACAAVAVGTVALPRVTSGNPTEETGAGGGELTYAVPSYQPGASQRVVVVGNSIPHSLMVNFPSTRFTDLDVSESTSFGCTTFPGQQILDGKPAPIPAACRTFWKNWHLGLFEADTMLYFLPQNLLDDYEVDGRRLKAGSAEHDAFIRSSLDSMLAKSKESRVKRPVLLDLACHEMPTFGQNPPSLNDTAKVRHLNGVAKHWAAQNKVQFLSQFDRLCPGGTYHGKLNGQELYEDALHYTSVSGPIMWSWIAPQIRKDTAK